MVPESSSHVGTQSHSSWDATFPSDPTDSLSFKETIIKTTYSLEVVEEEVEEEGADGTELIAPPPRELVPYSDRPMFAPRTKRRSIYSPYNSRSKETQCCYCYGSSDMRRGSVGRCCFCPAVVRGGKRFPHKRRFMAPGRVNTGPNNRMQFSSITRSILPFSKSSSVPASSGTF